MSVCVHGVHACVCVCVCVWKVCILSLCIHSAI